NPALAWMSEPFTNPPPGRERGFKAYGQIPDSLLIAFFDKYWNTNMQINMHVLGDQALEQGLTAIETAIKKHGMSDHRPVFVHCGYARPDQIKRMKAVGAIPTFLSLGIYIQGEEIVQMWGEKRASNGMAAQSMLKEGIPFSLSHDAPISSPQILPLVAAAVNRVTRLGKVIGPEQRISPYLALKAVTAWAAYQIKEENSKGSLKVGKLADLVILEKNPLKVPPMDIASIQVMETIKEGKNVYTFSKPIAYNFPAESEDHHSINRNSKPLTVHQQQLLVSLLERAK
ncbi:MAG: amidohydrolase family protein, partial [Sediminibacterium sp.]|nr:amidohydrolase family protein [Sediminibacterium sp.]